MQRRLPFGAISKLSLYDASSSTKYSLKTDGCTILYDADCSICTKFRGFLEFFDINHKLLFVPLMSAKNYGFQMNEILLYSSFHALGHDGELKHGAEAIPLIVSYLNGGGIFSKILKKFPGAMSLVRFTYSNISRLHSSRSCTVKL